MLGNRFKHKFEHCTCNLHPANIVYMSLKLLAWRISEEQHS